MCGIAGFLGGRWSSRQEIAATLSRMNDSLRHRGPDQSDVWIDESNKVGFAFDRLSIIDLSPAGYQPMLSPSGRFVIIFNGEIYNHQDLRDELEDAGLSQNWRGQSDTESLLASIEAWGVRESLRRATGMFAFALWDKRERTLTLARDRLGEKPVYYGRQGPQGPFLFGSELKALLQHPDFETEIDRRALTLLLRYNYIPAPFSIYRGIAKLPPASFLTLGPGAAEPSIEVYWSGADVAEAGVEAPLELSADEA